MMLYINTIGPSIYYDGAGSKLNYLNMLENGKTYVLIDDEFESRYEGIR